MTHPSAYERLVNRFRLIATIGECSSMLGWDAAAVMPHGGGAARGDQLAVLQHSNLVAPEVEADLATWSNRGYPSRPELNLEDYRIE